MTWLNFLLQVGVYKIEKMKQVVMEIEIFIVYCLGEFPYYKHDPKGKIKKLCQYHDISWKYTHGTWVYEEEYKWASTWQEIKNKLKKKEKDSQKSSKSGEMNHEDVAHEEVP